MREAMEYALKLVGSKADAQARHLLLRDRAVHEPGDVPLRTLILAPRRPYAAAIGRSRARAYPRT